MKSSKSRDATVIYARFYQRKVLLALYALAVKTDRPITSLVEQACAFAFSHPDFKPGTRDLTLAERSMLAKDRRVKKLKAQAAGL